MKRRFSLILIITLLLFAFTACGNKSSSNTDSANTALPEADFSATASDMFTKRDKKTDYDDNAVRILLNGSSATATSDKVQISGSTVTITAEDTYVLSGTLDDGTVVVNADASAKIHLIFDGININSSNSAAILILSADKVTVTLASEKNSLSNSGYFAPVDALNVNAALYSKEDLSLNGSGSLTINSSAGHGISCKDDLVLAGGSYTITAASHGLDANDSIRLTASTVSIESGKDGIHAENTDDTTLGFVYIADGTYRINAQDDGIHASSTLTILDGNIDIIESNEGLEALDLAIHGGNIHLIASDDGLNAADPTATNGFGPPGNGNFDFSDFGNKRPGGFGGNRPGKNKEEFSDMPNRPDVGDFGNFNPDDRPDNFGEAFDGSFPDGFGGGFPGGMSSSNCSITITGGNLYIQASGDGIDANGTLTISGGNITICGPNRGDTASLDYDTTATITNATFIATGATGMAQTLSSSEQGIITINVGNQNAGTTLALTDSEGDTLLTQTPELPYSLIILSSPDLKSGDTYTLTISDRDTSVITKTITAE